MRRVLILKLAALCAGVLLFSSPGNLPRAAAQDEPKEKTKAKVSEVDPFSDEKPKAEAKEDAPRPHGTHQITLHEPLAEGKTLEERLMVKATLIAGEAPLVDLVEVLSTALDAPVMLARTKLEEAAINLETPVTYRLRNVSLNKGLQLLLGEVGLTYVIKDDAAIVITTPEDAGSQLATRVYDCRELMKLPSPIRKVKQGEPAQPRTEIGAAGLAAKGPDKKEEAGPEGGYDIADLMKVITTTVTPDSWDEVGGPGSISDFKGLVTISTTQEVHERVERLLNLLHKAGGLEGKVKVSR